MDVQLIECKLIDEVTTDKSLRTFNREFATNLAESIRVEGLLNPIAVRPNPDKPGRYILVAGRHRLYAKKKVLKEQFVEANLLADMDADDHEMATIAENLWKNDISKAQRMLSTQRWHEYYARKYAPKPEPAAAQESAKLAEAPTETADNEAALTAAKVDANFVKQVAAVTGQSERTAARQVRAAKVFTADDLEAFHHMGTTGQQIEQIAKVKDDDKRKAVIALVASGLDFAESWKTTFGADAGFVAEAQEQKAAKAKAKEEQAPEQTDDEWFEAQCSEKAALLGSDTRFKQAALLYRRVAEARAKFRSAIKKTMAEAKAAGHTNFLHTTLNRVISLSHPKDWFLCEGCAGKGVTEDGAACPKCKGQCFQLRTENYL